MNKTMAGNSIFQSFYLVALALIGLATSDSCNSYCDEEGYFQNGFECQNPDIPYCCGDAHTRYCCNNCSYDASHRPPVYVCDKSSWWIFHWQIAIGMVGVIIIILILAICCCQCCVKKTNRRQRQMAAERRRQGRSRGQNDGTHIPRSPSIFSPEHPFAFTPPEYESLPKDPPPYHELTGQVNLAFVARSGESGPELLRSPSLPSYSESHNINGRLSDVTPPPYNLENQSDTTTPEASRRSSLQSGIVLNLSRRSSGRSLSGVQVARSELSVSKDKNERNSPTLAAGRQRAMEGHKNTASVYSRSESSGSASVSRQDTTVVIGGPSSHDIVIQECQNENHPHNEQTPPSGISHEEPANNTCS